MRCAPLSTCCSLIGQKKWTGVASPAHFNETSSATFSMSRRQRHFSLLAVAPENAQQHQQIGEDVVQVEIDRQGGRNVVGFAAADHPLQVDQQKGRENSDG